MKKLSKAIYNNTPENLRVTMPISKNMHLKASTNYWINYGKRNGITKSQMKTMSIEQLIILLNTILINVNIIIF